MKIRKTCLLNHAFACFVREPLSRHLGLWRWMAAWTEDGDCTSFQCFLPAAAPFWARVDISWNACRCSRFAGIHIVCAKIFSIKHVFTSREASIWITVLTLLPHSGASVALSGDKSLSQAVNWTGAFKVICRSSQGYVVWPEHPLICELERTWVSGYQPILRRAVFKLCSEERSLLFGFFSGSVWYKYPLVFTGTVNKFRYPLLP